MSQDKDGQGSGQGKQGQGQGPAQAGQPAMRLVTPDVEAELTAALDAAEEAELQQRFGITGVDLRTLQFRKDKDGNPTGLVVNLANASTILSHAWALRGMLGFDEFVRAPVLWYKVPEIDWDEQHGWMQTTPPRLDRPIPFQDHDAGRIQLWLQRVGRMPQVPEQIAMQAATQAAHMGSFHPVRDYLKSLRWDGVPRVRTVFRDFFAVEDNEYSRRVAEIFFVSCVKRVFAPGAKADYMIILEGDQGFLKSTFFNILAGEWFSDSMGGNVEHKDAAQHLRGKWIIEVAELVSMKRSEANAMKAFIAREVDRYRPSYGRVEVVEPRQCVFAGTTNDDGYLKDETGNRRYLPLRTRKRLDREALEAVRDQLWAEAVQMYRDGVTNWPTPEFEEKWMKPEQSQRLAEDPWTDPISSYLLGIGKSYKQRTYSAIAKDGLQVPLAQVNALVKTRIKTVMTRLGYVLDRKAGTMYWFKPEEIGK